MRQLQFVVLMAAFAVLGLMPSPGTTGVTRGDLILHLAGWIVGAISGRYAFPRAGLLGLGAGLLSYSLAIELAQIAVPHRSFELLDLVANGVGIVLGLGIMKIVSRRQ